MVLYQIIIDRLKEVWCKNFTNPHPPHIYRKANAFVSCCVALFHITEHVSHELKQRKYQENLFRGKRMGEVDSCSVMPFVQMSTIQFLLAKTFHFVLKTFCEEEKAVAW